MQAESLLYHSLGHRPKFWVIQITPSLKGSKKDKLSGKIVSASRIVYEIREQIFNEIGLRATARKSINKFNAKIARAVGDLGKYGICS